MKISPAGNNLIKNNLIKHPQLKSSNCLTGFKGSTNQPLTYKQVVPLVAVCATLPFIDKLLPEKYKKKKDELKSDCKKKIEKFDKKLGNDNFRRFMIFSTFGLVGTIYSFDVISKSLKNLTKTQKACEIAKWATKISLVSGLFVLSDFFGSGDYRDFFKKKERTASVQNNINNLNYKSDVFADFDSPTATTVNK